jgi:prepilin-type N-terminal cleavage/methylation domain-containing protein
MRRDRPRAGFTLVELMVVIAIIAAILAIALPTLMSGREKANAVLCQNNLKEIYNTIHMFKMEREHYPTESGVRFFLVPWHKKIIEQDPKNAKIYVCPGDENLLQNIRGDYAVLARELEDWDYISSEFTSYSGRNQKDHPLDFKRPASEPIVCDDDEGGLNHANQVNVLYLSGAIDRFLLADLEEGEVFLVGEESPIETFRVLSND